MGWDLHSRTAGSEVLTLRLLERASSQQDRAACDLLCDLGESCEVPEGADDRGQETAANLPPGSG
jgi:hypothetical protein